MSNFSQKIILREILKYEGVRDSAIVSGDKETEEISRKYIKEMRISISKLSNIKEWRILDTKKGSHDMVKVAIFMNENFIPIFNIARFFGYSYKSMVNIIGKKNKLRGSKDYLSFLIEERNKINDEINKTKSSLIIKRKCMDLNRFKSINKDS